jgi:hypothetical protein
MMMLLRCLEHALSDCGVSRQFTCLSNLVALSILIPLLRTTCYHASVAWVFSLATNPNPYDMWPHEGPEQVGPQTHVGPNLTQTSGSPHASDAKPGLVSLTRLAHGAGDLDEKHFNGKILFSIPSACQTRMDLFPPCTLSPFSDCRSAACSQITRGPNNETL